MMVRSIFARLATAALSLLLAGSCQARETQVHKALHQGIEKGYPGVAIVIKAKAKPAQYEAAGYADLEHQISLKADDCFHIGSITKEFTAVTILKLADQGKLSLDAKIADLLPHNLLSRLPYADEITVRQLLDHSSGIYPTNNDLEYLDSILGKKADPNLQWKPEQFVARAYEGVNAPAGRPGEGNHYSDTNYILLGIIAEDVSGRPFKILVAESILNPLGMKSTFFVSDYLGANEPPPARCVQGYMLLTKELRDFIDISPIFKPAPDKAVDGNQVLNTTLAAERIDAAAGIMSTLPDMLKFASALFEGKLLSAQSREFLMSVATGMEGMPEGEQKIRTLQAVREKFGVVIEKEGDGPGGTSEVMAYHPATGTIFIGFTNSFGHFDELDFLLGDVMGSALADQSQ